ncbi:lipoprotein LpqH [Tsukamurella sp. DT100]|uniref:lipoprotein LpqH n=1 Tax=Tsukamurella sp. DT100 TaxID=3393415 RepID=UPI003CFAA330
MMTMNRVGAIAGIGAMLVLTACGGGTSSDSGGSPSKVTRIPTGEKVTLTVDGVDVPVQPARQYSCKQRGDEVQLYNWSSDTPTHGPTATASLGRTTPDTAVSFGVNGVRYSVAENRPGTSATASKDGDGFVVEGMARSWDVTPEVTKPFRITFTCTTKNN